MLKRYGKRNDMDPLEWMVWGPEGADQVVLRRKDPRPFSGLLWVLEYYRPPATPNDQFAPPISSDIGPPPRISFDDEARLVEEIEKALKTRYTVRPINESNSVAAWNLTPLTGQPGRIGSQ